MNKTTNVFAPMTFLSERQKTKYQAWRERQLTEMLEVKQEANIRIEENQSLLPAEKATLLKSVPVPPEGTVTWAFTQTGIGLAITVKDSLTLSECDLTEYDTW